MERAELYQKIAGCLMAGALGDALGYEVEFISWDAIRRRFGEGGIQNLVPEDGKARFSDDTQMTLFTNEGLVLGYRHKKQTGDTARAEYYIYQAYLCWLKTQDYYARKKKTMWDKESTLLPVPELNVNRAPGNTCLSALRSGEMGTMEEPLNHSKGCGGVMRSAPAGFTAFWGEPLLVGAASGAITHGHPDGWIPAGMLSDIVYRIIYMEEKPLKEIVEDSLQAVQAAWGKTLPQTANFIRLVHRAMELAAGDIPDVDAIHSLGGGWVGDEALAIAIFSCLRHPDDLTAALISAVNHSGDSDSTGAIAGNILGARLGLDAIPKDWIRQLELTDIILQQADDMTKVG